MRVQRDGVMFLKLSPVFVCFRCWWMCFCEQHRTV